MCGVSYYADPVRLRHGRQTTCSRACSYELRAAQRRNSEERECAECGALVVRAPSQMKRVRHGELFCSSACAYKRRKRVVERPYNIVADYDRTAAGKKAWETRRANGKPYPEAAREKARARAIERVNSGFNVSQFERKAAEMFRAIGVDILTSVPLRGASGRFVGVCDIVVPARRIVIECHGNYWHGGRFTWESADDTQLRNLAQEERKVAAVRALGFETRLLWEQDFRQDPSGACLAVLR